jgi:hypothetical protein
MANLTEILSDIISKGYKSWNDGTFRLNKDINELAIRLDGFEVISNKETKTKLIVEVKKYNKVWEDYDFITINIFKTLKQGL